MNNKYVQALKRQHSVYTITITMLFALLSFFAFTFTFTFQNATSLFDNSMGMMLSKTFQVELLINVPVKTNSAQINKAHNHVLLSQAANSKPMTNVTPLFKSHTMNVAENVGNILDETAMEAVILQVNIHFHLMRRWMLARSI